MLFDVFWYNLGWDLAGLVEIICTTITMKLKYTLRWDTAISVCRILQFLPEDKFVQAVSYQYSNLFQSFLVFWWGSDQFLPKLQENTWYLFYLLRKEYEWVDKKNISKSQFRYWKSIRDPVIVRKDSLKIINLVVNTQNFPKN